MSCLRTQVSRPGLKPTLCWTQHQSLRPVSKTARHTSRLPRLVVFLIRYVQRLPMQKKVIRQSFLATNHLVKRCCPISLLPLQPVFINDDVLVGKSALVVVKAGLFTFITHNTIYGTSDFLSHPKDKAIGVKCLV